MKTIYNKIVSLFYSRTKLLQGIAIFMIFLAIGFWGNKSKTHWFWSDYPFIAILLVGISIYAISIWIKIEKNIIENKINEIKKKYDLENNEKELKLDMLSLRQHEVFQLIVMGKSNKEIMEELFVEHSTLKTHINKIYKILEIKNRKELRVKYKKTDQN